MSIESDEIIVIILERLETQTKMSESYHIERDNLTQVTHNLKNEVKSLQDKLYLYDGANSSLKDRITSLENKIMELHDE